jgi:hypothetical protein
MTPSTNALKLVGATAQIAAWENSAWVWRFDFLIEIVAPVLNETAQRSSRTRITTPKHSFRLGRLTIPRIITANPSSNSTAGFMPRVVPTVTCGVRKNLEKGIAQLIKQTLFLIQSIN